MKQRFRLYRRIAGGKFYLHNGLAGKQASLGTTDRAEAQRLLHARNEAEDQPAVNMHKAGEGTQKCFHQLTDFLFLNELLDGSNEVVLNKR